MTETAKVDEAVQVGLMEEPGPLPFAEFQARADDFIGDCNAELRRRGFHACEAHVTVDWIGQIVLHKNDMTGANGIFNINCRMPAPWQTNSQADLPTILNTALDACEKGMLEWCSRAKALRISFAAHGRRVSQTVATPVMNGNGRTRIVAP